MQKKFVVTGVVALGIIAVGGLSYYFARSGGGEIDVNQKITTTDQQGFAQEVRTDTRAIVPNGGLRPQGGGPVAEPPAPEPVVEETATSTDEVASSTESENIEAEAEAEVSAE